MGVAVIPSTSTSTSTSTWAWAWPRISRVGAAAGLIRIKRKRVWDVNPPAAMVWAFSVVIISPAAPLVSHSLTLSLLLIIIIVIIAIAPAPRRALAKVHALVAIEVIIVGGEISHASTMLGGWHSVVVVGVELVIAASRPVGTVSASFLFLVLVLVLALTLGGAGAGMLGG